MSKKALYNPETGETENIIRVGDGYEPPDGYELRDPDGAPDYNTDPPEAPEPVDRTKVSGQSFEAFKEARKNGDTETEIAIMWDILTGEEPPE